MDDSILSSIVKLLSFLSRGKDHLIIDADTHITDLTSLSEQQRQKYDSTSNYYHGRPISAEDLLTEMSMAGIDMSLIWQNPAATVYEQNNQEGNYQKLLQANRYILDSFISHPMKFIPAGWTDPKALGLANAIKLIHILMKEFGFFIIKMNPAQNAYPMYSKDVMTCVNEIVSLGGIPAFHYGSDTIYTTAEDLEKIATLNPDVPLLAVHMGGGGAGYLQAEETYQKSRDLGLRMPNIKFIFSAKRETHIESDLIAYQIAGAPYKSSLFCGSDAPYGRQSWNFGGYERMFQGLMNGAHHTDLRLKANPDLFHQQDVNNYLGGNFAKFIICHYQRFLDQK
ncbi:MAG: hypothetical protein HKN87_15345 [Saprospiraceae bacterium]|nr:hypothetical protein [Saprospiraceae bacterium]